MPSDLDARERRQNAHPNVQRYINHHISLSVNNLYPAEQQRSLTSQQHTTSPSIVRVDQNLHDPKHELNHPHNHGNDRHALNQLLNLHQRRSNPLKTHHTHEDIDIHHNVTMLDFFAGAKFIGCTGLDFTEHDDVVDDAVQHGSVLDLFEQFEQLPHPADCDELCGSVSGRQ